MTRAELIEQINDLLIVDLSEGASDDEIHSVFSFSVNALKQKFHRPWNKSSIFEVVLVLEVDAHHCVCFTGSGLSVCEDGAIVAYFREVVPSRQSTVHFLPTLLKIYY